MRIAQIRKMDISNGEGVGVSIFVNGCHFHCKGCHNYELWDFNGGTLFTTKDTEQILTALQPDYISRFSVLGGEPLEDCNLHELADLLAKIRQTKPKIKIWLYTGWTFEELLDKISKGEKKNFHFLDFILQNIDVLVDGPFIQELSDKMLVFKGSKNQRLLDAHKSMIYKRPVVL